MAKKQNFTFVYKRESIATIVVTAVDQEEAEREAEDLLKVPRTDFTEEDVEVEFLDLKDVEPDGPDRIED